MSDEYRVSRRSLTAIEHTTSTDLLEAFAAGYLRLVGILKNPEVQETQWQPGYSLVPHDEVGIRSQGMVSDPTANIAFDGSRLRVRAAVIQAEAALVKATEALQSAERRLIRALDAHEGANVADEPSRT